jgi:hypothetical protein
MKLIHHLCPKCRGDNCGYDACSTWDPVTEEWVLGSTYDNGWCPDCGDCDPIEVEITDPGTIAYILKQREHLKVEKAGPEMLQILKETLNLFDNVTALDDHSSNVLGQIEISIRNLLEKINGS